MPNNCDVAIVGAGPYGLSIAAHLREAGISFRIFGKPMSTWRDHMPKGMHLKSEGFASNLSAPDPGSTLEAWCKANGVPYAPQKSPIALANFLAYADWFTRTYVPSLEAKDVTGLQRSANGFVLTLEDGTCVSAKRVVLAVGITAFKHLPAELAGLPKAFASHSFDHHDCTAFAGRSVTVLGAGASAVDTAIAMHEAGAKVNVVTRRESIWFHDAPDNHAPSLLRQLQNPDTGIGPGWRSFFCVNTPLLFHRLPQKLRLEATRRHLGPAAGWFTRDKFVGKIPTRGDCRLKSAHVVDDRLALDIRDGEGRDRIMMTDHVVAATGYRVDLARLSFLAPDLRAQISQLEGTPILSDNFEASVPNLFFVGLAAANSFGPLLRFMCGAEFTASRLCSHLQRRIGISLKRAA
jgi:hypothetical protein